LPTEILTRPKQGFPVPVNAWLKADLTNWARELLTGAGSRITPEFSTNAIDDLLIAAQQGSSEAAGKLWLLIVLEFWLQAWDAHLN
jgi:asparagine synthase (glutamine-hydrolysing)